MMRRTSRHLCQPFRRFQRLIKPITLRLGTMILPIRCIRMGERSFKLVHQKLSLSLTIFQSGKKLLSLPAPVYTSMLLARTANTPNAVHGCVGFLQALENKVQSLEPHGDGRKDFAFGFVHLHALLDAIFGAEVAVEVDLGGGDDGEVGLDYDSCFSEKEC